MFQVKKSDLSQQEIQQAFSIFKAEHQDFQFIYTDGSKDDRRTGNGIITDGLPDLEGRLPDNTSVYIAELHAIFVALRLIKHYNIRQAFICSDSRSALQSLSNPSFKDHLHFELINLHQLLIDEGVNVSFLWIPGHSGIMGNERADRSAKRGLALPNITHIHPNHHSIRSLIRHCVTQFWERRWRDDDKRTQLHDIKSKTTVWPSSSRKNRLEEKALAKLRIGHTYLTHSFIFQHGDRPQCNRCHTHLTVKHILLDCRETAIVRQPLATYCRNQHIPFTLRTLLGDDHPELLQLLFVFLRKTALLDRL